MHTHYQKLSWHLKTSNSIYKLYTISQYYAKHQIYQESDFHDIDLKLFITVDRLEQLVACSVSSTNQTSQIRFSSKIHGSGFV